MDGLPQFQQPDYYQAFTSKVPTSSEQSSRSQSASDRFAVRLTGGTNLKNGSKGTNQRWPRAYTILEP